MKRGLLIFATLLCLLLTPAKGQNSWLQKATLPDTGRAYLATFSIGSKGYIVTGTYAYCACYYSETWEYDILNDTWTKKSNFPGSARMSATGFSIGNKGYVCGGSSGAVTIGYSDLWEYDPLSDSWSGKANFPGQVRDAAVGFSIGGKGYFGTGRGINAYFAGNDFWEYDPTNNSWMPLPNVPGNGRSFAISFVINNKGYVGYGFGNGGLQSDLYEFDPANNNWTTKSPVGFSAAQTGSFVISNKAYILRAYTTFSSCDSILWEYDPALNTITPVIVFAPGARCSTNGFSIAGRGYIGFGLDCYSYGQSPNVPNELYEFIPKDIVLSATQSQNRTFDVSVFPNPSSGIFAINFKNKTGTKICVYDILGNCVLSKNVYGEIETIDLRGNAQGIYFAKITSTTNGKDNELTTIKLIHE